MRWRAVAALVVVAGLVVSGCTGSDDDEAKGLTATLEILTTKISVAAKGTERFERASKGQDLAVGDRVRSDESGWGEILYHEGSLQRVENMQELTVRRLVDRKKSDVVKTGHGIGLTYNNVRELTEADDTYEVDTPVAVASVRGTIFVTECFTMDHCVFRVIEGTVEITPHGGDPIVVEAPAVLVIRDGEDPDEPRWVAPDVLRQDRWVEKNLGRDRELQAERDEDEQGAGRAPSPSELRTATLTGSFPSERTGVSTNYRPDHPNYVAAGSRVNREYTVDSPCTSTECQLLLGVGDEEPRALEFDGRDYVQREVLPSACVDAATGQPFDPPVAEVVVEVRWRPTDAVFEDGQWRVTRMEGTSTYTAAVLREDQFSEHCFWPTTDGEAPAQVVEAVATRR